MLSRSRTEMTFHALKCCRTPTKISHMTHNANINCNTLVEILSVLEQKDFIVKKPVKGKGTFYYFVTAKGEAALKLWNSIEKMFFPVNLSKVTVYSC